MSGKAPVDLPLGATCSNMPETVCQWAYAYRDPAAQSLFEDMASQLSMCLGTEVASDAPVNHPDSYDLRQYYGQSQGQGADVFLSIKDKASIRKTFVFLRIGPITAN